MLFFGALEDDFCLQRRLLRRFIFGFKNGVSLLKLQIHKLWFFLRLINLIILFISLIHFKNKF